MANQIGKLAVQITANAQPAVAGLQRAQQAVNSTSASMARAASATAKQTAAAASSTVATVGAIAGAVAGPLALIGGGVAVAGYAFKTGVDNILKLDMQARGLGLTLTDMRTLMVAAGPAADSMGEAVASLAAKLTEAREGGMDAVRSFNRLAALSGGPLAAGFGAGPLLDDTGRVLDRLAKIQNATARAAVGLDLFGSRWQLLAPEFARGAEGLERARQIVERFGLGVGTKDLANVRQVGRTVQEAAALWEGVRTQFVLGVAPIVSQLSKAFDLSKLDISGLKNGIVAVAENMAVALAKSFAFVTDPAAMKQAWQAITLTLEGAAFRFVEIVAKGMDAVFANWKTLGRFFAGMTGGAGAAMGFDALFSASQDNAGEARRKFAEARKALDDLGQALGNSDAANRVRKFFEDVRKNMGGPQNAVAQDVNWQRAQKLLNDFNGLAAATRTPLEAFREQMRLIGEMNRGGLFAGNPGLMARFTGKAFMDAMGNTPAGMTAYAGAALGGTREAYSAVMDNRLRALRDTPQERIRQLLEQDAAQQKAMERLQKDMADALKELNQKLDNPRGF